MTQADDAASPRMFKRINPVDGSCASIARAMSPAEARAVADRAHEAFCVFSQTGPTERRAMLLRAADEVTARGDDFRSAMAAETGATAAWAGFNVRLAGDMLREAASLTTQVTGQVIPSDKPGCLALSMREPAGVVLGIAPWNAPVILGVRAIATPLACGNAVVLKASESCPRTHGLIVDALNAAGLPEGTVGLVSNAPEDAAEVVGALIDHPAVRRINFTGSTEVGRVIARRAAGNLKPVLLELGGKAPLLVLADADLDEAVKAAAFGAFFNSGQICMSTERIVVVEEIADAFVAKLRDKARSLIAGDPAAGSSPLGAVIGRSAVDRVAALVEDAVRLGATCLEGGIPAQGVLMDAMLIDRVVPAMKLYREESFGPVVAVIRARDEDHAVEIANDSDYGLSAAVFTRDTARGLRVARRIRSGICHINGATVHDEAQMPFGGTKGSGYGRFGGTAGIAEFTELRWITLETQPGHFPI